MKPSPASSSRRRDLKLKISALLHDSGAREAPVDLVRVALRQGIHTLRFRPMRHDGSISAEGGGFRVDLRSRLTREAHLGNEPAPLLDVRQRFTLAHEIVHTMFPEGGQAGSAGSPKPVRGRQLEILCQFGAGHIVVPEQALRRSVDKRLIVGSSSQVSALSGKFQVSPEVMLRRLSEHEDLIQGDCGVVLLERQQGSEALVLAGVWSPSLIRYLAKPKPYSAFSAWIGRHWNGESTLDDGATWWSGTGKYSGISFRVSNWLDARRVFLDVALISL
jgi:hypothetical protein